MLHALTIRLVATEATDLPETHGHFAHATFLALLNTGDTALAARVHDMTGAKPFTTAVLSTTLSPAPSMARARGTYPARIQRGRLEKGEERLLRVTLLDGALYQPLMAPFLRAGAPPTVTLGAAHLCVAGVQATPGISPWVGYADPSDLLTKAATTDLISLVFESPTAFSRGQSAWGKMMDLLPAPSLVFDSLIGKWKAMAQWQQPALPLPDRQSLLQFVEERVVVKEIEHLKTVMLRYTSGPQIGVVGALTYQIKGETSSTSNTNAHTARAGLPDLMPLSKDGPLLWLNALADFAFYSGIGYRTTLGMGQARRVRV
jgi:CRISPR-associated endoribonuclease Cas6